MLTRLVKLIYSFLVKVSSRGASLLAKKPRLAYLLSFTENDQGLITQLQAEFPGLELVVFYTSNCAAEAEKYRQQGIEIRSLKQGPRFFIQVIPWLTQAQIIICDNYFAFLADLNLSSFTQVYQIWHANGAIKTFGWQDQATAKRSQGDQKRFQRVYNQFNQILVGSEGMATIFKNSYRVSDEQILKTGLPRTDYYFDDSQMTAVKQRFAEAFPEAKDKKVLLYVPTYRPEDKSEAFDLKELLTNIGPDYFLLCKLHPHSTLIHQANQAVMSDLRGFQLAELLPAVDVLITDYSSVPFEFSLANPAGKVIFYCYDLAAYQQEVGLQADFLTWAEKAIVKTQTSLAKEILRDGGLSAKALNQSWNQFNDGKATARFLAVLKEHVEGM